ncbi:hypothetical protein O181_042951 [Austropuccinia psidii MF-1]|uniref:Uncharacterized protein n=1 Tax=Austropuccinia psidii MF-1 TaxID=1389203 RepID=A0A9Q3DFS8_9BASI|nr:hypothetical protein [Austropuccinia psidii MF-1]
MSHPWRQEGLYQSLPIKDLSTPNQQGGFMEDPPNTVSNLNTAQYRKPPNTGCPQYRCKHLYWIHQYRFTSQIKIPPAYNHGFSTLKLQAGIFSHIPAPFDPPGGFSPS